MVAPGMKTASYPPPMLRLACRCFWVLPLACLTASAFVPTALPAATQHPSTGPADGQHFLDGLAQAEREHDYAALLAACDRQVAARPQDREAYRRRALARWGAREYEAALADFNRAVDLARRQKAPARAAAVLYYGRALVRREQHEARAEAAELDRAIRADCSFTDPLNDLAWLRATDPDHSLRDGRQAVALARRACDTVPGSAKYLDTLAAAYAEAGDAKHAADAERAAIKAIHLDPEATAEQKDFLANAQEHADLYARGWRYEKGPYNPSR